MNTLILSGFGTNCERETAYACTQAGADPATVHVRHISEIYSGALTLEDYAFVVLIGGFMDGDDLGGARACANRFRYRRMPDGGTFLERLRTFVDAGRPVLGICNGFQLLIRLGFLPGRADGNGEQAPGTEQAPLTITTNARGRFEDRWVHLRADPASPCVFTRGVEHMELPIRHGEGRLLGADDAVLERLVERNLAPLRYALPDGTPTEDYPANPNGSAHGVAALCNATGTVMGLMPHPEAFNHATNHPRWTRDTGGTAAERVGAGVQLFRNAYEYLREQRTA